MFLSVIFRTGILRIQFKCGSPADRKVCRFVNHSVVSLFRISGRSDCIGSGRFTRFTCYRITDFRIIHCSDHDRRQFRIFFTECFACFIRPYSYLCRQDRDLRGGSDFPIIRIDCPRFDFRRSDIFPYGKLRTPFTASDTPENLRAFRIRNLGNDTVFQSVICSFIIRQ